MKNLTWEQAYVLSESYGHAVRRAGWRRWIVVDYALSFTHIPADGQIEEEFYVVRAGEFTSAEDAASDWTDEPWTLSTGDPAPVPPGSEPPTAPDTTPPVVPGRSAGVGGGGSTGGMQSGGGSGGGSSSGGSGSGGGGGGGGGGSSTPPGGGPPNGGEKMKTQGGGGTSKKTTTKQHEKPTLSVTIDPGVYYTTDSATGSVALDTAHRCFLRPTGDAPATSHCTFNVIVEVTNGYPAGVLSVKVGSRHADVSPRVAGSGSHTFTFTNFVFGPGGTITVTATYRYEQTDYGPASDKFTFPPFCGQLHNMAGTGSFTSADLPDEVELAVNGGAWKTMTMHREYTGTPHGGGIYVSPEGMYDPGGSDYPAAGGYVIASGGDGFTIESGFSSEVVNAAGSFIGTFTGSDGGTPVTISVRDKFPNTLALSSGGVITRDPMLNVGAWWSEAGVLYFNTPENPDKWELNGVAKSGNQKDPRGTYGSVTLS